MILFENLLSRKLKETLQLKWSDLVIWKFEHSLVFKFTF